MSETSTASGQLDALESYADGYPFGAGERLASKYELIERLGAGGLGCVFAARHVGFDSKVALKFLHPEYASDADLLACFKREARAGFQIDSKHVVRVIDLEELADGTPFIVMEHLRGVDLQHLLESTGKLPSQRACQYVLQVCAGLQAAHELGVIHRDIKPGNLFLVSADEERKQDEHIKLLDFGISKLCTGTHIMQTAGVLTHSSQFAIGTPQYMSPEQVRGAPDLDTRTDIWSLGCVLYELLTGVSPFRRASVAQTCAAVLEDKPLTPLALSPDLPAGLAKLVLSCLTRDPKQRPPSVQALAAAIAPYAATGPQLTAAEASQPRVRVPRARVSLWAYAAAALFVLAFVPSLWRAAHPRSPRLVAQVKGLSSVTTSSHAPTLRVAAPELSARASADVDSDFNAEAEALPTPTTAIPRGSSGALKHRRKKAPAAPSLDKPKHSAEPDVGF